MIPYQKAINDIDALKDGGTQPTFILENDGAIMSAAVLPRLSTRSFQLVVPGKNAARVAAGCATSPTATLPSTTIPR